MDALLIFLKYPQLGRVKTRLAKSVGDKMALRLYTGFVQITIEKAICLNIDQIFIFYTPFGKKQSLKEKLGENFVYYLQRGASLGERMYNALKLVHQKKFRKMVIIGTDSPTMPLEYLKEAFAKLDSVDIVIGPCEDGGYYVIGMKEPIWEIFQNIDWSTEKVYRQTVNRAGILGLKIKRLPVWYDIDTVSDLQKTNVSADFFIKNGRKMSINTGLIRQEGESFL